MEGEEGESKRGNEAEGTPAKKETEPPEEKEEDADCLPLQMLKSSKGAAEDAEQSMKSKSFAIAGERSEAGGTRGDVETGGGTIINERAVASSDEPLNEKNSSISSNAHTSKDDESKGHDGVKGVAASGQADKTTSAEFEYETYLFVPSKNLKRGGEMQWLQFNARNELANGDGASSSRPTRQRRHPTTETKAKAQQPAKAKQQAKSKSQPAPKRRR